MLDYNKHRITTLKQGTANAISFVDAVNEFEYKVRLGERMEYTKDGYLIFREAIVGNLGELRYSERELGWSRDTTPVRVLREADEVFDENSLASLEGAPVTILHPDFDVNSNNFRSLGHGTVLGKPKRVGENMVVDIIIHSAELVDLIAPEIEDEETGELRRVLNDSFKDLSLGYSAKLVQVALDLYKQTNIIYNHLAVVPEGRQANARLRDMLNPDLQSEKEVKTKMSIMEKLFKKGKVVVRDEKGITVSNDEIEILLDEEPKEETKDEKEKETKQEDKEEVKDEKETKEVKDKEKEKDEPKKDEDEKMVKDKKYFVDALKEAQLLPDGVIKTSMITELNNEFLDAFPDSVKETKAAFADEKPINSNKLDEQFKDAKAPTQELDFDKVAKIKADYYRKLTDPFMHKDWAAFNDHYNSEKRKGRSTASLQ